MRIGRTIAVIGTGKLGGVLIRGLLESKAVPPRRLLAVDKDPAVAARQRTTLGVRVSTDATRAAREADVLVIAVRPPSVAEVLGSIREIVRAGQLVISTAAGVPTAFLERHLPGGIPVVRVMPNTPCRVRAGMTAVCGGRAARREHLSLAMTIFGALGRVLAVEERHMDAVTGLSGSGPAFLYVVLDALAEGGVAAGLPRDAALELAAQTMVGAARMVLETGEHPARLKDGVATPGGCTVEGLMELESGGLRGTLVRTVVRAARRAAELVQR